MPTILLILKHAYSIYSNDLYAAVSTMQASLLAFVNLHKLLFINTRATHKQIPALCIQTQTPLCYQRAYQPYAVYTVKQHIPTLNRLRAHTHTHKRITNSRDRLSCAVFGAAPVVRNQRQRTAQRTNSNSERSVNCLPSSLSDALRKLYFACPLQVRCWQKFSKHAPV